MCLSVYSSICLSVYMSVFLSIYLSVYLSICLFIVLSVCLSFHLSMNLRLVLPEEDVEPDDTEDRTDKGDRQELRLEDITEFKPATKYIIF